MKTANYYTEVAGGGLQPATPARIVCYDEGNGEWTIEAQDADGAAIRDAGGCYLSLWHDDEALGEFSPMDRDGAIAEAVGLAAEMGLPMLPVYFFDDGGLALVAGGSVPEDTTDDD